MTTDLHKTLHDLKLLKIFIPEVMRGVMSIEQFQRIADKTYEIELLITKK